MVKRLGQVRYAAITQQEKFVAKTQGSFMQIITNFVFGVASSVGRQIEYAVLHMNLTQWAIFAVACLGVGAVCLRSRRI